MSHCFLPPPPPLPGLREPAQALLHIAPDRCATEAHWTGGVKRINVHPAFWFVLSPRASVSAKPLFLWPPRATTPHATDTVVPCIIPFSEFRGSWNHDGKSVLDHHTWETGISMWRVCRGSRRRPRFEYEARRMDDPLEFVSCQREEPVKSDANPPSSSLQAVARLGPPPPTVASQAHDRHAPGGVTLTLDTQ
ncbi:hypothetical protein N7512_008527 [Penicillium capsulatum]|nr:hypothetical protein N7512_008527 [Penicillium capsulatum]